MCVCVCVCVRACVCVCVRACVCVCVCEHSSPTCDVMVNFDIASSIKKMIIPQIYTTLLPPPSTICTQLIKYSVIPLCKRSL